MRKLISILVLLFAGIVTCPAQNNGLKLGLECRYDPLLFIYTGETALTATAGYMSPGHNYIGIQTGYALGNGAYFPKGSCCMEDYIFHAVPVIVEARHHFMVGKSQVNSFAIGIDVGPSIPFLSSVEDQGLTFTALLKAGFDMRIKDACNMGFYLKAGFLSLGVGLNFYI